MKLTFIGTSHGVPAGDRYCSCIMLEVGESIYFIDAGAPVTNELLKRGKDLHKVRAMFNTHIHGDHTAGYFQHIDLLNWYYKDVTTEFYFADEAMIGLVEKYIEVLGYGGDTPVNKERIRMRVAKPGVVYSDENICVTYFPNMHLGCRDGEPLPSYSIMIEGEGKRIIFTGDLSIGLKANDFPIAALEETTDAVICEMAHFGYEQVKPYLEKLRTDGVWFTHVFPLSKLDQINENSANYHFPLHCAYDGEEVII